MVSFCSKCGTSLPYADIVFKNGEETIADYYRCPECKNLACDKPESETEVQDIELDETSQLVIRQGECQICRIEEATEKEAAASTPESEEVQPEAAAQETDGTEATPEAEPAPEQTDPDTG